MARKKLYKVGVRYGGYDTYILEPNSDKAGNKLNAGSVTIEAGDEQMRKYLIKHKFKDCESSPDSAREMKYGDMVMGIKSGDIKELWVWNTDWEPKNGKVMEGSILNFPKTDITPLIGRVFELTEKVYGFKDDVDFIFDKVFLPKLEEFLGGKMNVQANKEVEFAKVDSSFFKTKYCMEADRKNRIQIVFGIFKERIQYSPSEGIILISLNQVFSNLLIRMNYDFQQVKLALYASGEGVYWDEFKKCFSERNIKTALQHELAHWIRMTLDMELYEPLPIDIGVSSFSIKKYNSIINTYEDVNASFIEIDAQVHEVAFLRSELGKKWDSLSFFDLLTGYGLSIGVVYNLFKYDPESLKLWKFRLMRRLLREGLLNKKMIEEFKYSDPTINTVTL